MSNVLLKLKKKIFPNEDVVDHAFPNLEENNSVKLFSELLGRNGFGKIDMDRTETPKEG